ncbi:MAG: selenium metabolism-associated LysR family transcriptional regulator [Dehalobacterium sp.]
MKSRLLTFIIVAERESFSLAAKELHLTQPAITQQIKYFEDYYGVQLFRRTYKEVKLTPAGQVLYNYAKKIMKLYELASNDLSKFGDIIEGNLVIGAGYTTCEHILPYIVSLFKSQFPDIELTVKNGNYEEVLRRLNNGELDVALIAGECDNKNMSSLKLFTDELVLIVSSKHQWANLKNVTIEDLVNENFILREKNSTTYGFIQNSLKEGGFDPDQFKILAHLDNHEAIKRLVEANFGVSIISKSTIHKELKLKTLQIVKVKDLKITRNFNLIYPKNTNSPKIKKFIKFCKKTNWHTEINL